mmetsp:Transcript_9753/g.20554  ORF Transcript_9753/g.20554 Transcript_9753/m.20554 type:complete len:87 (+) Transcript_9753:1974-2234(+)
MLMELSVVVVSILGISISRATINAGLRLGSGRRIFQWGLFGALRKKEMQLMDELLYRKWCVMKSDASFVISGENAKARDVPTTSCA